MSEYEGTLRSHGDAPPPRAESDGLAPGSIGEYLKRQRLLRGITVEELSATTRIPLRSLERLEAGYFDGVSDGFVRGFVRTVSLALGLDADQAVARMLEEPVAGRWDREGSGLWRKQLLAVVALAAVTVLCVWMLRAGWNLLVDGSGSKPNRDVVVWVDPVHRLAREVARRSAAGEPSAPSAVTSDRAPSGAPSPDGAAPPSDAPSPETDAAHFRGMAPGGTADVEVLRGEGA
jgi:hypothetical protein